MRSSIELRLAGLKDAKQKQNQGARENRDGLLLNKG
jgi:hypothetical protein